MEIGLLEKKLDRGEVGGVKSTPVNWEKMSFVDELKI